MPTIPPHSLIAFGLFLRLPGYAEVLLKERKKAQCLLRLVLGVTDDGDGGEKCRIILVMGCLYTRTAFKISENGPPSKVCLSLKAAFLGVMEWWCPAVHAGG